MAAGTLAHLQLAGRHRALANPWQTTRVRVRWVIAQPHQNSIRGPKRTRAASRRPLYRQKLHANYKRRLELTNAAPQSSIARPISAQTSNVGTGAAAAPN